MKKRYTCLLILVITLIAFLSIAYAHPNREQHWADIELVLFGNSKYKKSIKDTKVKNKLIAIEYASTLAIDQYNGDDGQLLNFLKIDMGYPNLPDNVTDTKPEGFNYTASFSEHRQYTHRGWDLSPSPYIDDRANWPIRRDIMLNTFSRVFGFNYSFKKANSKCDALCALCYYVHVIGDQENDSKYAPGSIIMPLGRHSNLNVNNVNESNADVFSQLEYYLPRLFKDQQNSKKYLKLMEKLERLSKRVRKLDENGITKEEQKDYQNYAKSAISLMSKYIPVLLKEEDFFSSVFYSE